MKGAEKLSETSRIQFRIEIHLRITYFGAIKPQSTWKGLPEFILISRQHPLCWRSD